MKKISREASKALLAMRDWKQGNTHIVAHTNGTATMYLHGNAIAKYDGKALKVSWAGWATRTTCERLNALPGVTARIVAGEVLLNDYTVAPDEWLTV